MNLDHSYKTTNILFTLPPFCPEEIQSDTHEVSLPQAAGTPHPLQVLFEEFGFASALCRPAPWFSAYEYSSTHPTDPNLSNNSIVIDSGFSFTHVLPFIDGSLAKHAVSSLSFLCL
jgi:actin-related protein